MCLLTRFYYELRQLKLLLAYITAPLRYCMYIYGDHAGIGELVEDIEALSFKVISILNLPCSYDEEEECVNQYECQPLGNLEKIEIGTLYFYFM